MDETRKKLWIAMSALWLDAELDKGAIAEIAQVVRESGLTREELEAVFRFELAPFLGRNLRTVAGVWDGFDPEWVCQNAQERHGKRRHRDRITAFLGITTASARPAWDRVLQSAFRDSTD